MLPGDGSADILVDVAALLDCLKGRELIGDHVALLPGHVVALLTWHLHAIHQLVLNKTKGLVPGHVMLLLTWHLHMIHQLILNKTKLRHSCLGMS
jgi:hypothetical protein